MRFLFPDVFPYRTFIHPYCTYIIKTFYSHTCISNLNAYQISSMNFFLSNIPLYLIHCILVGLTEKQMYMIWHYVPFYYFYSFIFTQSLYYVYYISFILIKFNFLSILRCKYNMVFTQPLCMQ